MALDRRGLCFRWSVSCLLWVLETELVSSGRHPNSPKNFFLLVCFYCPLTNHYVLQPLPHSLHPSPLLHFPIRKEQAFWDSKQTHLQDQAEALSSRLGWRGFNSRAVPDIWSSLPGPACTRSSLLSLAVTGSLVCLILRATREPNGMSRASQYFITSLRYSMSSLITVLIMLCA